MAGGVPGLVRLQLGAAEPTLPTRRERAELRTPVRSDWPGTLPHGREFAAGKVAATVSACRRGGRRFAPMTQIESKHDVRRKVREAQAQANRERLKTESDNREDMVAFLVAQQKLTAVDEWESDRHEQVRLEQTSAARNSASRVLARWRGCVIAGSPWPALRRSAGAARKSCAATSKNCAPRCRDRLPTAGTVRKHRRRARRKCSRLQRAGLRLKSFRQYRRNEQRHTSTYFNTARRKQLNSDSFEKSVAESRCSGRRLLTSGLTFGSYETSASSLIRKP